MSHRLHDVYCQSRARPQSTRLPDALCALIQITLSMTMLRYQPPHPHRTVLAGGLARPTPMPPRVIANRSLRNKSLRRRACPKRVKKFFFFFSFFFFFFFWLSFFFFFVFLWFFLFCFFVVFFFFFLGFFFFLVFFFFFFFFFFIFLFFSRHAANCRRIRSLLDFPRRAIAHVQPPTAARDLKRFTGALIFSPFFH